MITWLSLCVGREACHTLALAGLAHGVRAACINTLQEKVERRASTIVIVGWLRK
jgi:hypothetical protein